MVDRSKWRYVVVGFEEDGGRDGFLFCETLKEAEQALARIVRDGNQGAIYERITR